MIPTRDVESQFPFQKPQPQVNRRPIQGNASKIYLLVYNTFCAIGWFVCLTICFGQLIKNQPQTLWKNVEYPLKVIQTCAIFEVVHAIIGIVKSNAITTTMQVFSRVWTLWAVVNVCVNAQTSFFFTMTCLSWSLVEVPRYIYYACDILLEKCPYQLLWLRYSLFLVLYPLGITGEIGCMYQTASYLYESSSSDNVSVNSNHWQYLFGVNWLLILIVIVAVFYIPGSPIMYRHMLHARRKALFPLTDKHKS